LTIGQRFSKPQKLTAGYCAVYPIPSIPNYDLHILLKRKSYTLPVVFLTLDMYPTINNYQISAGYEEKQNSDTTAYRLQIPSTEEGTYYLGVYAGSSAELDELVTPIYNDSDIYQFNFLVELFPCPNNCSGKNGHCDLKTHKCTCRSGFFGNGCSMESHPMELNSKQDLELAPDNWVYIEYKQPSNEAINISVLDKKSNSTDLIFYLGDGFLPNQTHYYAVSRRLEQDDQKESGSDSGSGSGSESSFLNLRVPNVETVVIHNLVNSYPSKDGVTFHIGIWNGDTISHKFTVSLSTIGQVSNRGRITIVGLFMFLIGIGIGIVFTIYGPSIKQYFQQFILKTKNQPDKAYSLVDQQNPEDEDVQLFLSDNDHDNHN